jgi:hypothetical protein
MQLVTHHYIHVVEAYPVPVTFKFSSSRSDRIGQPSVLISCDDALFPSKADIAVVREHVSCEPLADDAMRRYETSISFYRGSVSRELMRGNVRDRIERHPSVLNFLAI